MRVVSRAAMDILFLRDISHAVIVTIIECRIARRDGYHISKDVSRTAKFTIIEDRVVRCDRCIDRYIPHGS